MAVWNPKEPEKPVKTKKVRGTPFWVWLLYPIGWLRKLVQGPGLIVLLVLLPILEVNFRFFHFKGEMPFVSNLYWALPSPVQGVLRFTGKAWAFVTLRDAPVGVLPDHVIGCVPQSVITAGWESPQGRSNIEQFRNDVTETMMIMADRYAVKDMDYIENEAHRVGNQGHWIIYIKEDAFALFGQGTRPGNLVDAKRYNSTGWDFTCGNTAGREKQEDQWEAYAFVPGGKVIPVTK